MNEDNKLDQEPGSASAADKSVEPETDAQSSLPLYLRKKSEGNKGNAQDEKDESAE